ncbi:hypothetical protein HDU81_008230 [Chytriomyces hyalinus]|nr:hypothetical protein HDU81_008230 [Chytriomyces hyalinus]
MPKILLNPSRNNLSIEGVALLHQTWLDQSVTTTSDVTFGNLITKDLTATGNVTFTGNITEIETERILFKNNYIDINADNTVPIVTGDQTLKIGFNGNTMRTLATTSGNPTDGGIGNSV